MNLKEAAQQALEALEVWKDSLFDENALPGWRFSVLGEKAITDLRAALADTQDWDEIEALRASLREHMAEIKRLRAAGRQALGALQFCLPLIEDYGDEEQLAVNHKALAELTEYAMQRLADEQQMIERGTKAWADVPDATAWVDEMRGNVPALTSQESRQVEPVAYVTGFSKGYATVQPVDRSLLMPVGMALYRSPPKRDPLTEGEIRKVVDRIDGVTVSESLTFRLFARAIERAHDIGGEE